MVAGSVAASWHDGGAAAAESLDSRLEAASQAVAALQAQRDSLTSTLESRLQSALDCCPSSSEVAVADATRQQNPARSDRAGRWARSLPASPPAAAAAVGLVLSKTGEALVKTALGPLPLAGKKPPELVSVLPLSSRGFGRCRGHEAMERVDAHRFQVHKPWLEDVALEAHHAAVAAACEGDLPGSGARKPRQRGAFLRRRYPEPAGVLEVFDRPLGAHAAAFRSDCSPPRTAAMADERGGEARLSRHERIRQLEAAVSGEPTVRSYRPSPTRARSEIVARGTSPRRRWLRSDAKPGSGDEAAKRDAAAPLDVAGHSEAAQQDEMELSPSSTASPSCGAIRCSARYCEKASEAAVQEEGEAARKRDEEAQAETAAAGAEAEQAASGLAAPVLAAVHQREGGGSQASRPPTDPKERSEQWKTQHPSYPAAGRSSRRRQQAGEDDVHEELRLLPATGLLAELATALPSKAMQRRRLRAPALLLPPHAEPTPDAAAESTRGAASPSAITASPSAAADAGDSPESVAASGESPAAAAASRGESRLQPKASGTDSVNNLPRLEALCRALATRAYNLRPPEALRALRLVAQCRDSLQADKDALMKSRTYAVWRENVAETTMLNHISESACQVAATLAARMMKADAAFVADSLMALAETRTARQEDLDAHLARVLAILHCEPRQATPAIMARLTVALGIMALDGGVDSCKLCARNAATDENRVSNQRCIAVFNNWLLQTLSTWFEEDLASLHVHFLKIYIGQEQIRRILMRAAELNAGLHPASVQHLEALQKLVIALDQAFPAVVAVLPDFTLNYCRQLQWLAATNTQPGGDAE
eukprot:TRINITY_DN10038_c0_g1_i1.p1 TRINITY_DN10038_c0_g1~~TRINITY_DN10038_c0_g1_i1.p1  ORF type:complete len:827 (+),score=214.72 TRINITY_DN10038_c0_g1_i1:88-2568(+)